MQNSRLTQDEKDTINSIKALIAGLFPEANLRMNGFYEIKFNVSDLSTNDVLKLVSVWEIKGVTNIAVKRSGKGLVVIVDIKF